MEFTSDWANSIIQKRSAGERQDSRNHETRKGADTHRSLELHFFRCPPKGPYGNPVGQKRQIDVAGQKLPRDNVCLSLVSHYPHRGVNLERG